MTKFSSVILLLLATSTVYQCQLNFLEDSTPALNESFEPYETRYPTEEETLEFANGVLEGLGIFTNLPNQDGCLKRVFDPRVPESFVEIGQLFNRIKKDEDLLPVLQQIAERIAYLYPTIRDAYRGCAEWGIEISMTTDLLIDYVSAPDYLSRYSQHLTENYRQAVTKGEKAYASYLLNHWSELGRDVGDLLHFAFLWDFGI